MGWCKQIKFLPIGTWSHLSSKWEEMKHIRFMGLMEEGSGKAKWLRFFSALMLEVSGTNHISCFPVHPVVYKSQVRVKSKSDIFFFFNLINSVIHLTRWIWKWLCYHK